VLSSAKEVEAGDELRAQAAGENFPVALRLLPARYRRRLMAVYAFARTVDDAGDRGPAGDRMALLAGLEADLRLLYAGLARPDAAGGEPAASPSGAGGQTPRNAAVSGLAATITECQIPMEPFLDLIGANVQDQQVSRYETAQDLLGYCRLSANPVGRIVLYVFGCFTPEGAALSDFVCSGLQLAEHWQDVAEDYRAGRVYLPQADMREHGCADGDLAARSASPQLRRLVADEVAWARELIDEGAPLIGQLRGAARAAVAGYVAGGRAALAAIAAAEYDPLAATPRPGKARTAAELALAYARGR
jgi:squalene synthase HpnC